MPSPSKHGENLTLKRGEDSRSPAGVEHRHPYDTKDALTSFTILKRTLSHVLLAWMSCMLMAPELRSEDSLSSEVTFGAGAGASRDLSLSNFFSEGWDQPWTKRRRGEGTPDMSLLRVQTNLNGQLLRIDALLETGLAGPGYSQREAVTTTLEYALNRRFMPAVFVAHHWLDGRHGEDEEGTAGGLFGRFHLIETQQSSLALNLKMTLPDRDIGEHLTAWSYALAGWADLNPLGLRRTGLYYHVQHEMLAGPQVSGGARNDTTYDLSLAKTWTSPQATLENFTTFVEAYGRTLLDGEHAGGTVLTLTPGFRFTLATKYIFMLGVDLPVTGHRVNDQAFRFSWIANF